MVRVRENSVERGKEGRVRVSEEKREEEMEKRRHLGCSEGRRLGQTRTDKGEKTNKSEFFNIACV